MDYVAGITACDKFVGEGPRMKLYLQEHPSQSGRCVNIITLEGYVSQHYADNFQRNVNAMRFQTQKKKNALLRIATRAESDQRNESLRPHMTFGSCETTLRWHEAALIINGHSFDEDRDGYENGILKMTHLFYRVLDEAILEAKALFIDELKGNTELGQPESSLKRKRGVDSHSDEDLEVQAQSSVPSNKYNLLDITPGEPHDAPDSIVSQCSNHKQAFSPHSDTRPKKFCNHNDYFENGKFHENSMRILTHCGVASINDDESIPSDLLSIKHGIPRPNKDGVDFCRLIGHFSFSLFNGNESKGFVSCEASDSVSISMGGMFHGHAQLWGSQGDIFHYLEPLHNSDNFVRVIHSPRLLTPFKMSPDVIRQRYEKTNPTIYPASLHNQTNVLETKLGKRPYFLETGEAAMVANRTSTSNTVEDTQKQLNLPRVLYKQSELKPCEETVRDCVIGNNGTTDVEDIARSGTATLAFYDKRVTVALKRGDGKMSVLVGPQVIKTSSSDERVILLRPGEAYEEMHSVASIKVSSHRKHVLSPEKADNLAMFRPGKNCGLLANVEVAMSRSKRGERGKLKPMCYRHSGGVAYLADSLPMDSSNRNVTKSSPTHIVSPNQSMKFDGSNDKNIRALWEQCLRQGVVNVFFGTIYIGPFIVSRYLYQRKTHEEAHDEMIKCKELLNRLKESHKETLFKSNDCLINYGDKEMEMEMQALTSMGHYFELLPLDPQFIDLWSDDGEQMVQWKLVELEGKDFVMPKFNCPKEKVDQYFGLSKGAKFDSWFSLLQFDNFPFLTEGAKDKLLATGTEEDEDDDGVTEEEEEEEKEEDRGTDVDHFHCSPDMSAKDLIHKLQSNEAEGSLANISARELIEKLNVMVKPSDDDEETEKDISLSTKSFNEGNAISLSVSDEESLAYKATFEIALNAAIHVTGAGWERACGDCVSFHNSTIEPPREILSLVMQQTSRTCSHCCKSYTDLCWTCYEKAMNKTKLKAILTNWTHPAFANVFEPPIYLALTCTDSFNNLVERNGRQYVLERKNEAWTIFFRCFLCCVINSPILYLLTKDDANDDESLLVPPPTQIEGYISSIRKYKWERKFLHKHFRGIVDSTDDFINMLKAFANSGKDVFIEAVQNGENSRTLILKKIMEGLNKKCEIKLTVFQVHVIMRCIENCIHIPFGKVLEVPMTGYGGKNGAKCFLNAARADTKCKSINKNKKINMKDVPFWLLTQFNDYARSKRDDNIFKKVLLVLCLKWCDVKDCLVHSLGIGKELDASDMEHLLCAFSSLHQKTLPSRNIVSSTKIDDDKFFPLYSDDPNEIPFMRHLQEAYDPASQAYKALLCLEEFFLSELFTVDCTHI